MHERLVALIAAPLDPMIAGLAGVGLGLVFFGGLWWTVRRMATFRWPALGVLASLLLRMTITLVGFRLAAGDDWVLFVLCMVGFVLARVVVSSLTRPPSSTDSLIDPAIGTRHAP